MTPVGGSRHYQGGGLGEIGIWACPSCGEDNTGRLEEGCTHCGAGKPGNRPAAAAAPPPPPPVPQPTVTLGEDIGHGDVADSWAEQHPEATVADAYRAGYEDALRQLRAEADAGPVPLGFSPNRDQRIGRTIVAALTYFRDQVLLDHRGDEEIETGEWATADEVTALITDITTTLEVPHA